MLKIRSFYQLNKLLPIAGAVPSTKASLVKDVVRKPAENLWASVAARYSFQLQLIHIDANLRKYNKNLPHDEEESDNESDEEFKDERDSKVVRTKVSSLRADLIIRVGLGMARNKIEAAFYDSKIRVNGEKLPKKSVQLSVGDEIDVVKGFSQSNPSHIIVARVIILSAKEQEDCLRVALRRYKSLLLENYGGMNAFKSSETSTH